jgi:hypothetical protein
LGPRFAGSNLAKGDGFIMAIKICSMTFFEGEHKPSVPCYEFLWCVKDPYRYERDTF